MSNILEHTLTELSVRHTKRFVEKIYDEDPDRDNMLGLSRMLGMFGVESKGYALGNPSFLTNQIVPVIAATTKGFILIDSFNDSGVSCTYNGKRIMMLLDDFLKIWTGAVLVLEKKQNSCEPDYEVHVHYQRNETIKRVSLLFSAGSIAICCLGRLFGFYGPGEWIYLFLNLVSFVICGILMDMQVVGKEAKGYKTCQILKKDWCSSVHDSKFAKPFLSISWAEIGLGFFGSNILIPLLIPMTMPNIVFLSVCSVVISILGLGYQAKREKLCPFCIMVHICVFLQCIEIFIFRMIDMNAISIRILLVALAYTVSIIFVHYSARIISDIKESRSEIRRLKSIVTNSSAFVNQLKEQKRFDVSDIDSRVIIGPPSAPNTISILSNPHCAPCSKIHEAYSSLLKQSDLFKIRYIFTTFTPEMDKDCIRLLACFKAKRERFDILLDEWFKEGKDNPDRFFNKHVCNDNLADMEMEYSNHKKWALENGLNATPTILVNGYLLPKQYSASDLLYLFY